MLSLDSALAIGALAVAGAAQAPVLRDDSVDARAGEIATGNVLANDTAAGPLRVVSIDGAAVGSAFVSAAGARVRIDEDGAFVYDAETAFGTLPRGAQRVEAFRYVASDGVREADAALVVSVAGVNDPPAAPATLGEITLEAGAATAPFDAGAAFSDPGDTLTFSATGLPAGLSLDPMTGVVSGAPVTPVERVVEIAATDGAGQTATAPLTIRIVSGAPQLRADAPASLEATAGAATTLDIAALFAAEPAVTRVVMAPGSDAMPAGLALSATGLISGTPTIPTAGPRAVRLRAEAASGAFRDVTITMAVAPAELISGDPGGADGVVTGTGPWTATPTGGALRMAWPISVVEGATYRLRLAGAVNGAPQWFVFAIRGTADFNTATIFQASDVTSTNWSGVDQYWTADRTGTVYFGLAASQGNGWLSSVTLTEASATAVPPPAEGAPTLIGTLARDPVQRAADVGAALDFSGDFSAASHLSLAPDSAPMPAGLALAGTAIVGAPTNHGQTILRLIARDAEGRGAEAAPVVLNVADVVAAPPLSRAPTWRLATPASFDLAAIADPAIAADPDRVFVAETPLPEGMEIVGDLLTGAPTALLSTTDPLRIAARAGARWQRLMLEVGIEAPVTRATGRTPAWSVTQGSGVVTRPPGLAFRFVKTGGAGGVSITAPVTGKSGVPLSVRLRAHLVNFEARANYSGNPAQGTRIDLRVGGAAAAEAVKNVGPDATGVGGATLTGYGSPMLVGLHLAAMPDGAQIDVYHLDVFDVADQVPVVTTANYDETVPLNLPTALNFGGAFVNEASIAASGLPPGLSMTPSGVVTGAATEAGDFEVTLTARTGDNTATSDLTVTVAENAFAYATGVEGPWPALAKEHNEQAISTLSRQGPDLWRVGRRGDSKARAVWRLRGLTKGARYTITPAVRAGTLPAGRDFRLMLGKSVLTGALALDRTWLASDAAPMLEFIAPENEPWLQIEGDTGDGAYFELSRPTITPLAGDEPVAGGGHRIEAETTQAGGIYARRVFNLAFARRYDLSAAAPGATRIALSLAPTAPAGNLAADPNLAMTPFEWAAASVSEEVTATAEIMWLVADAPFADTPTLAPVDEAWPPALPDSGSLPFPFTTPYPAVPASPDFEVGPGKTYAAFTTALWDAVEAAALLAPVTVVVDDGDYARPTIGARRFKNRVTVMARNQHGVVFGSRVFLTGVRNLTLTGFRYDGAGTAPPGTDFITWPQGGVQFVDTMHVGVTHSLLRLGATLFTPDRAYNFHLHIRDNDVVGGPFPDGLEPANPVGDAVILRNAHGLRLIGNRVLYPRADHLKIGGQRIQFDHNLLFESYKAVGDYPGYGWFDDHADIVQGIEGFATGLSENRRNREWVVRRNVMIDDLVEATGSTQTFTRGQGFNIGNQSQGAEDMLIEQNLVKSGNALGIAVNNATRGLVIRNNTLVNPARIQFLVYQHGFNVGEVSRNATDAFDRIAVSVGGLSTGVIMPYALRVEDNYLYGATSLGAIFDGPGDIYGHTAKPGGPLAPGGSHAGAFADELAAMLAAKPAGPAGLSAQQWTLEATGPGSATLTILTAPPGGDSRIAAWEVSVNGGPAQPVALDLPFAMSVALSGLPAGAPAVRVRAVTAAGDGDWSEPRTVPIE